MGTVGSTLLNNFIRRPTHEHQLVVNAVPVRIVQVYLVYTKFLERLLTGFLNVGWRPIDYLS